MPSITGTASHSGSPTVRSPRAKMRRQSTERGSPSTLKYKSSSSSSNSDNTNNKESLVVQDNNNNTDRRSDPLQCSIPVLPDIRASNAQSNATFLRTLLAHDELENVGNREAESPVVQKDATCDQVSPERQAVTEPSASGSSGPRPHEESPRRLNQGTRQRTTPRYISSTVHIISHSDGTGTQTKTIHSNYFEDNYNYRQHQDQGSIDNDNNNSSNVISTSRPHADGNKSVDNETKPPISTSSDNPCKSSEVTEIGFSSSPHGLVSSTRPRNTCDNGTDSDTARAKCGKSSLSTTTANYQANGNGPALSQWTTCRALDDDDDDDDDDYDEDEGDENEEASIRSNVYYADDEGGSRSRTSSMSSVPAAGRSRGSSPIWLHDRAAGRLSRMASTSNLIGTVGRKRRPLLLPPIMMPPIYATKPTPLVLRDDVYFASTGGAARCKPVSNRDWDRLWDCRYLRIPNRTNKRAIRV